MMAVKLAVVIMASLRLFRFMKLWMMFLCIFIPGPRSNRDVISVTVKSMSSKVFTFSLLIDSWSAS